MTRPPPLVASLLLAALVAVLVGGCSSTSAGGTDPADAGVAAGSAGCTAPVARPFRAPSSGVHVQNGTRLTYPEAPPAAGVHWAVPLARNDYRVLYTPQDRPAKELLVHSLEHGWTVVWYDLTLATDEKALAALRSIAEAYDVNDGVLIAPWGQSDGPVFPGGAHLALTHWTGPTDPTGVHQYCRAVSGEVVASFHARYPATNAPEPGAF